MIEVHRFDQSRLKKVSVRNGDYVDWLDVAINDESCVAAFQEFRADEELGYWVMWYDEIHFAMKGEAECIYSMPPTYDEEVTLKVKEGDLYLIPIGAQVRWRVIGDEPYRTMFVCMPRPRWFEF
jgi:ethanolamine utilization protein EutQ (cupin superfamily)